MSPARLPTRMSEPTTRDGESNAEAIVESVGRPAATSRKLRWGAYLLGLSGSGLVANGLAMLYRALYGAGFEAGVAALGGVTRAELASANPELAHYVDHLHVNVAGLMVAVGLAVAALAWYGVRRGQRWAWATAVAAPAVFLAHSIPVHGTAGFAYDALSHLGPGAVWVPALLVGAVLSHLGLRSVERRDV